MTAPGPVAAAAPTTAKHRPNIVVIMADDMRNDDLRWMPQTRRVIGAEGVRFAAAFSPYPLCCPARASFLTGQYPHNHHVWGVSPPYGFPSFRDRSTLPVWLRRSGYQTLFLGKYLNGYGKRPTFRGKPSLRYVPPGWTDWRGAIDGGLPSGHPLDGGSYRFLDTTLNVNGRLVSNEGRYQTHMLGNQSVQMIRKYARSDRPFFMWANYVAPHHGRPVEPDDPRPVKRNDGAWTRIDTTVVPPDVRGRFDSRITTPPGLPGERNVSDKPAFIRKAPGINKEERRGMLEAARQRAEALSVLDDQVARSIRALRGAGELDQTLVMFTSDNGYFRGEHRRRQGKTMPYEPALRVPLLMRGPGIPAGVTRHAPFIVIDFAPTILRAARAPLRASLDGRSLLGIARHGGGQWLRGVLTETGPANTLKYLGPQARQLASGPQVRSFSVGVRTKRYLYVRHLTGGVELYDLRHDPRQLTNVAGLERYADVRRHLTRVLRGLEHCAGDECRRRLSSW